MTAAGITLPGWGKAGCLDPDQDEII